MKRINWRYAIGELLIITIGISLAFGLNNWASNNKDHQLAREYLNNIKSDLEWDINMLDTGLAEMNKRAKYFKLLFAYFRDHTSNKDSLDTRVFQYFDPVRFYSRQPTFQSMKYSGDIKLIKNGDLKNRIVAHYEIYRKIEAEFERHNHYAREFLAPYFMEEVDFASLRTGAPANLDDPQFQKLLYSLFGIYLMEIEAYEEVKLSAERLVDQL